jgi:Flp pilus assembly protein TadD
MPVVKLADSPSSSCSQRRVGERHTALFVFLIAVVFFAGICAGASQEEAGELLTCARHLESQGRYEEAVRIYQDLARGNPRSPQLLYNLGQICTHMGNYAEAIAVHRKALKLDPTSASLLANLGLACFKSGHSTTPKRNFARWSESAG